MIFKTEASAFTKVTENGKTIKVLKKEEFEKFNPSVLGLGNISNKSAPTSAIAAVFDLQGFTNFCKQIDPQLSVPLFLSEYLDWIFTAIRNETSQKEFPEGNQLWHSLPFLTKFMGDGLLVLWSTENMTETHQHNLIITLQVICEKYITEFLPIMKRKVCEPPSALRCGLSKGTVFSVGDGNDFVGPCINLAARLQKLDSFSFAFSRRGFNPDGVFTEEAVIDWVLKKVSIRGMGEGELVYLLKTEFEKATHEIKEKYTDP